MSDINLLLQQYAAGFITRKVLDTQLQAIGFSVQVKSILMQRADALRKKVDDDIESAVIANERKAKSDTLVHESSVIDALHSNKEREGV